MFSKTYSDQTGGFPMTSATENKYIFVFFDSDSNLIWEKSIKTRSEQEFIRAFNKCYKIIKYSGAPPTIHVLDNEISMEFEGIIKIKNVKIQITSLHNHRRNAAEKAIGTIKLHFINDLSETSKQFPIKI